MALNTPFDYGSVLNGIEIIFRALKQQKKFADANEYGMTWNAKDSNLRDQADDEGKSIRNKDFFVAPGFDRCIEDPPCPWDKNGDDLKPGDLMPIIMANDGLTTYNFKVSERTDSGTTSYAVGPTVAQYGVNQSELDPAIQSDFLYYERNAGISYIGDAIIVIEKVQNGSVLDTFQYLFNLK